ncbi:MAG TPA: NINE protein [bacterium]|nr:NINE protein [bacterium]
MCTKCGVSLASTLSLGPKNKLVAGLLGILLGSLGIHKFYLGYNKEGIIMLVVSVAGGMVTCGAGSVVVGIIGLIEGILYLTKSDEEFDRVYVQGTKTWF